MDADASGRLGGAEGVGDLVVVELVDDPQPDRSAQRGGQRFEQFVGAVSPARLRRRGRVAWQVETFEHPEPCRRRPLDRSSAVSSLEARRVK